MKRAVQLRTTWRDRLGWALCELGFHSRNTWRRDRCRRCRAWL